MVGARPRIGVLALQGGVAEHARLLDALGAEVSLVRRPDDLPASDGIVLPGGESTTIDRLLKIFHVRDPLIQRLRSGLPVLGTCAGLILLAREVEDPAAGQQTLGILDVTVRRNAFGPQVDSAEAQLSWGATEHVRAAFIRAPEVVRVGSDVEVTSTLSDAALGQRIVGVRAASAIGISFHPELTGDATVHREFLRLCHRT